MIDPTEHMGLAVFVARKFYKCYYKRYEFEDLVQSAEMGLIYACKKFDESRGLKFSTYAVKHIEGYLLRMIRSDKYYPVLHRDLRTKKDIPEYSSLNCIINDGEDHPSEWIDFLPYEDNLEDIDLKFALSKLTNEEQMVIRGLFYQERLQREIAKEMGTTQVGISRIKCKALEHLRQMLAA